MKKNIKGFLFGIFCLLFSVNAAAQQEQVKLTGTVAQRKNYQIMIACKLGDKSFRVASYFIDTTSNKFSLAIPFHKNGVYQMRVVVMKKGHRRLEADYDAAFALKVSEKEDLNIKIDPALFTQEGKGLTIEKLPVRFSTVSVSGLIKDPKLGIELSFEKVVEGRLQTIQSIFIPKGDSTFKFIVPLEKEGFYYLSTVRAKKRLYLRPNDQVSLTLDAMSGIQAGSSSSSPENGLIAQWEQLRRPLASTAMENKPDRDAFTASYKLLQPKITAFMQQVKTPNPRFNQLFKTAVQLDNNLFALKVLLQSSTEKRGGFLFQAKDFLNVPPYYQQILKENRINSTQILQLGEGSDYLSLYAKFTLTELEEAKRKQLADAEKVKLMMGAVSNDTLKSFLLKSQLEELEFNISNYSEFREVFIPYQQYAKQASVKEKYLSLFNMFAGDTAFIGKSAYDFTLPDVNGKMVSMQEFKGKVVLIDVWATWCGPCKAQMPFLKEVEEHYKGNNNIVFVGISLDAEKDKQKWLNMIKDKQLEGVQLLDDLGKSFGRKYKAVAIPRFFLIDKNGKWSEVRCPLPETGEKIKKYIDKELNRSI